ncbi:MAG TPA: DEAD/DEAH box helicase [Gemmatimonadaceae bacterium]|nr:DEAD/DEAH box helicase [Gemmatimonadaceae bacterium]
MGVDAAEAVKALIAESWLGGREVAPALGEVTLAPHQREAVARVLDLLDEYGGALLADETGMGKTYVALAVARTVDSFLVVAPASLRETWRGAFARAGVSGGLLTFESLSRAAAAADAVVSLVIVDEAHHIRNPRTRRYTALARLTWGSRVLLLTATPIHNRPRDLRSQLGLFLGTRARTSDAAALARLVVRRTHARLTRSERLPLVEPPRWLSTPHAPAVLRATFELPPAVPPAGGGEAHALLRLGLLRAWTSSAAALRAALVRRLRQAAALTSALDAGRFPSRGALGAWTVIDDALQLAFPELVADLTPHGDAERLRAAISAHVEGVRRIQDAVRHAGDPDDARAQHLRDLRRRHRGECIVAFTHFVETARGLFRRLAGDGAVALVTAQGARIASGAVRRAVILDQLAPGGAHRGDPRLPVSLLLATDVLSEGLNLQQASVLVHLDLPWTAARLEQRLGRVRRMGSPHARVHVYAIGPPPQARELSAVVRAVQRKLRLVTSLAGVPDATLLDCAFGAGARRCAPGTGDLTGAVERLRAALEEWRSPASAVTARNVTPVAVRRALPGAMPGEWEALALVSIGTRHRLVVVEPRGVSAHPQRLLDLVRAERESTAAPEESQAARGAVRDARTAVDAWLAERRGTLAVDAVLDTPSPAHAAVLRWLDHCLARARRHERPDAALLIAGCRSLVLGARGAGAEEFLAHWLQSTSRAPADIETLSAALAARSPHQRTACRAPPALRALLVLVRTGEGG